MNPGYMPCPHCTVPVRTQAKYCPQCGREIPQDQDQQQRRLTMKPEIKGLLAGLGIAVIAVGAWLYIRQRTNPPNGQADRLARQIAAPSPNSLPSPPPSPPPLVSVTKFSPIVNGNVVVPPLRIQYFKFIVPQVAQDAKVTGAFRAFGGAGNDIEAAIMTPLEFENWSNGREAHAYYTSGKVSNGEIEVDGIPPGFYILAFSNKFALVSRKEVTAQVSLTYTVLEHR